MYSSMEMHMHHDDNGEDMKKKKGQETEEKTSKKLRWLHHICFLFCQFWVVISKSLRNSI